MSVPPPPGFELVGNSPVGGPPPPPGFDLIQSSKPDFLSQSVENIKNLGSSMMPSVTGMVPQAMLGMKPENAVSTMRGVVLKPPMDPNNQQQQAFNAIGAGAIPAATMMALGPVGGSMARAAALRFGAGPLATGAAEVLGSALAQGGAAGASNMAQGVAGGKSPSEQLPEAIDSAKSATKWGVAIPAGIAGAAKTGEVVGKIGTHAIETASKAMSGTAPQTLNLLRKFPKVVLGYARMGMGETPEGRPVAVAMQKAQELATTAQEAVANASEGAGKSYGAMKDFLSKAPEGLEPVDLFKGVSQRIEPYIDSNAGLWRNPNMSKMAMDQKKLFDHFYLGVLRQGEMSPKQVADTLEDITQHVRARDIRGTPLAAHLSELKNAIIESLPEQWSKHVGGPLNIMRPGYGLGWNIKATRAEYKAAKELERQLGPFSRADSALRYIKTAMNSQGTKLAALKKASGVIPELKAAIDNLPFMEAGAQLAPNIGNLPRTGLLGSAITMATKLAGSLSGVGSLPLLPVVASEALGASPRATAEVLANGRNLLHPALDALMKSAIPAQNTVSPIAAQIPRSLQRVARNKTKALNDPNNP